MVITLGLALVLLLTFGSNPIYSILTLISSSLVLGLLLLSYGLQFVSFLIVLIYIGAVSVLFLFVVMMINFRLTVGQLPVTETFVFWGLTAVNLASLFTGDYQVVGYPRGELTNFESLGSMLYQTSEIYLLAVVGLILFVAMIGAISLTYIASENYRTQHVPTQTQLQIVKSYRLSDNRWVGAFSLLTISTEYLIIGLSVLVTFGICLYDNVKRDEVKKNFFVLASDPIGRCFQLSYNAVALGTMTQSKLLFIVALFFQFCNFSYDVEEVLELVVEKIPELENVLFMGNRGQRVKQIYNDYRKVTINNPTIIINYPPLEVKNSTSEKVFTLIVAGTSQVASFGVAITSYLWGQNQQLEDQNQKLEEQNRQKDEKIQILEQDKKLSEMFKSINTAGSVLKQELSKTDSIAAEMSTQSVKLEAKKK